MHAANSAALLRDSRVWYDRVRPGLLLYGIVPPPLASTLSLTPIMTLGSRVVAVKGVRPDEGVGYGVRFSPAEQRRLPSSRPLCGRPWNLRLAGRGQCDSRPAARRLSARSTWTC